MRRHDGRALRAALLLSGGSGTRIASEVPKQYLRIGGRMIVTRALAALTGSAEIDTVRIVAAESWREEILADARAAGLDPDRIGGFDDPGATRQLSIVSGLRGLLVQTGLSPEEADDAAVLVHDAARPFVTEALIHACFAALPGHDGVMPVLPMKDTVYLSDDGVRVKELLDRSRIYAGQAPELFALGKYLRANEMLSSARMQAINGATEPAILAGMDIAMIPGEERNFKITTQADLARAEELLREREDAAAAARERGA